LCNILFVSGTHMKVVRLIKCPNDTYSLLGVGKYFSYVPY